MCDVHNFPQGLIGWWYVIFLFKVVNMWLWFLSLLVYKILDHRKWNEFSFLGCLELGVCWEMGSKINIMGVLLGLTKKKKKV